MVIDEKALEAVARAICADLARQDHDEFRLDDTLKLPYLDQGEVNFAELAAAAILAYEAAKPALAGAVAVKPLEWEHGVKGAGSPLRQSYWNADRYQIVESPSGTFDLRAGAYAICATLDEAKAAAQADYDQRILSALAPAPARDEA